MERIREETIVNKVPIPVFWKKYVRVGEDITEKKAVLCPWHDDHRPSMAYNGERRIIKCFSCGSGGNIVDIACLVKKINREDAIKFLAKEYGIKSTALTLEDVEELASYKEDDTQYRLNESKLITLINKLDNIDAYILLDLVMSLDLDTKSKSRLYEDVYKEVIAIANSTRDFKNLIRLFCCNDSY